MSKLNRIKELLWIVAMCGLVATIARLYFGLGATTHLTDAMPWGLWKIFNMVAGVALATGGFTLASAVYVFHLTKYRSLMKPAIVVAFLGYGSSVFSLLWDIGLPHRIWHPIIPSMWNVHSFLFEVAWCVMLYFTVSLIELSPTVLEKVPNQRVQRWGHWIHKVSLPIVIFGITLSTMHHSSLGSLFLVSPGRLHPLWYVGNWLPLQFFVSAVGGGMMTVVFVSLLFAKLFKREPDMPAISGVARAASYILMLFLAMRIAEFTEHGKWGIFISGQWEVWVFLIEITIQTLVPIAILSVPKNRVNVNKLMTAAAFAMLGLALQRMDTGIGGYARWLGTYYFPSIAEIAFSLGVYAAAGLLFLLLAEHFDVYDKTLWKPLPVDPDLVPRPFWSDIGVMSRISLAAVLAVPLSVLMFSGGALQGFQPLQSPAQKPVVTVTNATEMLKIDGNHDGKAVIFNHNKHIEINGGDEGCASCHHIGKPGRHFVGCHECHSDMKLSLSIFDHMRHEKALGDNDSCEKCHDLNKPKNIDNTKPCITCHEKDMNMKQTPKDRMFVHTAVGYVKAMHSQCKSCHATCVECHKPTDCAQDDKFKMPECNACH